MLSYLIFLLEEDGVGMNRETDGTTDFRILLGQDASGDVRKSIRKA